MLEVGSIEGSGRGWRESGIDANVGSSSWRRLRAEVDRGAQSVDVGEGREVVGEVVAGRVVPVFVVLIVTGRQGVRSISGGVGEGGDTEAGDGVVVEGWVGSGFFGGEGAEESCDVLLLGPRVGGGCLGGCWSGRGLGGWGLEASEVVAVDAVLGAWEAVVVEDPAVQRAVAAVGFGGVAWSSCAFGTSVGLGGGPLRLGLVVGGEEGEGSGGCR